MFDRRMLLAEPRAKIRQGSPRLTIRLTELNVRVPSARRMYPVFTRTITGPLPFRYRVTRNRWTPVGVGPSSARPSKTTEARARFSAVVEGIHEASAEATRTTAVTAAAKSAIKSRDLMM